MSKAKLLVKNQEAREKVLNFFSDSPLTEFETCFKLRDMLFTITAKNLNEEFLLRNLRLEMDILRLTEYVDYQIIV